MGNGLKLIGAAVVALLGIIGACCVFAGFLATKPAQDVLRATSVVASGPDGGTRQATPTTATPTDPEEVERQRLEAGWRDLVARAKRGETLDPARCKEFASASYRERSTDDWPALACAWTSSLDETEKVIVGAGLYLARASAPADQARLVLEGAQAASAYPSLVSGVRGDAIELSLDELRSGLAKMNEFTNICSRCARVREVRSHVGWLEYWAENPPTDVSSVETLKLRHHDLREKNARVAGFIAPASYHNCGYRSTSRWRSFTFDDSGSAFGRGISGMHVYCEIGVDWCDDLYTRAVAANERREALSVTALVRYPRSNRICEEGQAELIGTRR